ncbi:MAG: response regulator transcription factor [Ectothiorhodospiraceae bacterium]|nr:response regulator transcription factor [Ectothiorhodospiraceae bacterium]MCH8503582.1 response regulator transcription factor [Ectothiorhodospiraceae bacterium]
MRNVLVLEDHPDTRGWLCLITEQAMGPVAITEAATLEQARHALTRRHFNLALVDISLPDGSGISLIQEMRQSTPETFIVVVSIFDDDEHLFQALHAGASGYLLKDQADSKLVEQLKGIANGSPPLSPGIARRILRHFQDNPPESQSAESAQTASHLLSEREIEVLGLLAKGMNRGDIGRLLGISVNTAAVHVKSIYRKLNVSGRAEATLEAINLGIVQPNRDLGGND